MEHRKFQNLNVNNLWQCETTQKSFIIKLPAFGKLTFIKFLSIRTNQVNLKVRFCVVLISNMAVYTEFYPVIFHFEIQKKHGKHLKIQKIFWICLSNTIYKLIRAELNLFLQYEASIVRDTLSPPFHPQIFHSLIFHPWHFYPPRVGKSWDDCRYIRDKGR